MQMNRFLSLLGYCTAGRHRPVCHLHIRVRCSVTVNDQAERKGVPLKKMWAKDRALRNATVKISHRGIYITCM